MSSTVDFEKENSVCIIVVNYIQCFSALGINKFLSLEFDYQSILIKIYSFGLYFLSQRTGYRTSFTVYWFQEESQNVINGVED